MSTPRSPNPRLLFEGEEIEARPDDTVASALLRAGVTVFSRGPKYHRPRGPFCLSGTCAQCHMRVGGEPNVPTCTAPVRDGLRVERQNVLGTGDTDLLRAVDFIYRGGIDHHHLMTRFRALNAATQAIARRLAGIGEVPDRPVAPVPARQVSTQLVVVGAGPAGLSAAAAASRHGVRPLVLDVRGEPGGHVRDGLAADPALTPERVKALADEVARAGELASRTMAIAIYADGARPLVLARGGGRLWQITAERVVIATGGLERQVPFEANDLPGVYAARGLLRLVQRHGFVPGTRAVIVGSDPDALRVARGLAACGAQVEAVLDPAGELGTSPGVDVRAGVAPVRALGRSRVEGLLVRDANGRESRVRCDVVAVAAPLQPAYELAAEAGARVEYRADAGGFAVVADEYGRTNVPWLFAAGRAAAAHDRPLASGELAGLAAASSLREDDAALSEILRTTAAARGGTSHAG